MDENGKDRNLKNRIFLSRNTPVALVVGAAGFLGSQLTEYLLEKGLQVVGVDNFSTGKKQNLEGSIKNSKFHFIESQADDLSLDLERLDYIFILAEDFNLEGVLKLFLNHKARCLFISWIDLYAQKGEFKWFKEAEAKLAKFAHDHNLNARILRLGPVFGPRMSFKTEDPIIRLIQAQLLGEIQKESALEFSSRALFVWDACDLMIKSIFAGATAQKIFDGVLPTPIKVSEIKQVLLDPVWYEERGFTPSELPPWPTPNLEKTIKILNWRPKHKLVESLRKTLSYFKDYEIKVPKLEDRTGKLEVGREEWEEEKKGDLEGFKLEKIKKEPKPKFKIRIPTAKISLLLATALIVAGLIYPILAFGWAVLTFGYQLQQASASLGKGDFDGGLSYLASAKLGLEEIEGTFNSLEIVRKVGLEAQFEQGYNLLKVGSSSIEAHKSAILGIKKLLLGLKATTGEKVEQPFELFSEAQAELDFADNSLSTALALTRSEQFSESIPKIFQPQILRLGEYLESFNNLVKKAQAAAILLPRIISSNMSYLILLQNNMELRPGGGFIGSYGLISFEGGKLKKLEVNDIYAIDGQLKIHVEPPKEIKEDLGQKDWFLRDSNFEPDLPTSAKQAEWFFNQETGTKVAGVFALDVTAMENLLEALGPLELLDYNEKITSENLFEKAITHAEQSFFPGSQAKKSFLTALTAQTFNKIFFLPNQNWAAIVQALGKSLETKHMSIFLDDPRLFSFVVSQNWDGSLPRPADPKEGEFRDFLAPVEANLGANKANYYLDRSYNLETVVGKEGEIRHRLKITYLNRSPSEAFPAGKYKNRFRIYLPFGSKLTRVLWGETDITRDVSAFVDFGRSGYSLLLELAPKEQKALILDYEVPGKLEFKDKKTTYRLDIIKQAGTLKDPLEWKISYPISYQLVSSKAHEIGPQEHSISTDLSKDRSFEVIFTK